MYAEMKKKILLVSANQYAIPSPVYPLGLAYISAYLKERLPHYDIQVFDFLYHNHDTFIRRLQEYKPDYVGVSLRNIDDANIYKQESFINQYRAIINSIRNTSHSIIVLGGPGYSIFPQLLFDNLKPDFAIQGEGEESFYKLLKALEDNTDYTEIDGLVYMDNNETYLKDRTNYLCNQPLSFDNNLLDFYWKQGGMLNIQTKRGCPYHCIYCTYPLIDGHKVRTLNSNKIADTLADLYFNKRIDYVFFTDSIFNVNNEDNFELAEKIINKKMNLKWGGYFNFTNLDEKLLQVLQRAGLVHIEFGTDSLSDITLKKYGKPFTFSDVLEVSKICNKLNIDFANFLILSGYGDTDDTLNETFENSKKIKRTVFFPFVGMRIYPGTRLQDIAISENKISKADDLLEPTYYKSNTTTLSTLKEKARKTGKRWVFPDEDLAPVIKKLRTRNMKGPLWEYLIQ